MKQILLCCSLLLMQMISAAQIDITVKIDNYPSDSIWVGAFVGANQEILDTLVSSNQQFTIQRSSLAAGMYFVYMPPKKIYLPFYIDKNTSKGAMKIDFDRIDGGIRSEGLKSTKLFYDCYTERKYWLDQLKSIKGTENLKKEEEEKINEQLVLLKERYIEKAPNSIAALDLKLADVIEAPKDMAKEEAFYYIRNHWFDNVDVNDDRFARLPETSKRIYHYFKKMIPVQLDSIKTQISAFLDPIPKDSELRREATSLLKRRYNNTGNATLDKAHAFLVENYLIKPAFKWVSKDSVAQLRKEIKKPSLNIGDLAPSVPLPLFDIDASSKLTDADEDKYILKGEMDVLDLPAAAKILFVWDPDCSHCRKEIPKVREVLKKYSAAEVDVLAVCTEYHTGAQKCVEAINEEGIANWHHAIDPYYKHKFKSIYNITGTPRMYIVDQENRIRAKNVKHDKLEAALNRIIQSK